MPNSKAEQRPLLLAWDAVYKGHSRADVANGIKVLLDNNTQLDDIRVVYMSGRIADYLGVTRKEALAAMELKGNGAKVANEFKREAEQELAYGAARVAWNDIKRAAGIPPAKKRSDARKRSPIPPNKRRGASGAFTPWLVRQLMRAAARRRG